MTEGNKKKEWNWEKVQEFMTKNNPNLPKGRCLACGKIMIQAVASQHIKEDHPEIYENIMQAVERSKEITERNKKMLNQK